MDLVLPDEIEDALSIMGVDRKNVRCPPSGRLRCGRRLRELRTGVVVERGCIDEVDIDPSAAQLDGHGISVLDQERDTEQRQRGPLTGCRRNRVELAKT